MNNNVLVQTKPLESHDTETSFQVPTDYYINTLSGRKALILNKISKRRKEGTSDDNVGVKRIPD